MCHSNCRVSKINFNDIIGSSNSVLNLMCCIWNCVHCNHMNEIINAIQFHSDFPNFHKCYILHCSFKIKSNLIWVHFLTILMGKRTFSVKSGEIENQKICIACIDGSVMAMAAKASNFIRFAHFLRGNLVIFYLSRLEWYCIWLVELFSSAICTLESAVELEIRNSTSSTRSRSIQRLSWR